MDERRRTVRTLDLLRKKDLHPAVEMPKSTVADWIEDFNVYIPKVKQGNVTYYKPETIDVLNFIKKCREQNYQKHQIMQLLTEKGFPITVEEAIEDVKNALEVENPRDTLLAVMKTMGQAVSKIAEQDERLDGQDEALKTLESRQVGQDERLNDLEERTSDLDYLKQEIETLKKELAVTQEELKKEQNKPSFFSRLFGKK